MRIKVGMCMVFSVPVVIMLLFLAEEIYFSYKDSISNTQIISQYLKDEKKKVYDKRMLISQRKISSTLQILTSFFMIASSFQKKTILGNIKNNPDYQTCAINTEALANNEVTLAIQQLYKKNRYHLDVWQNKLLKPQQYQIQIFRLKWEFQFINENITYINRYLKNLTHLNDLSDDVKTDIKNYEIGCILMRSIMNTLNFRYNATNFTSFLLARVDSGLFYFTPANNSSLIRNKKEPNCKYNIDSYFDIRCRGWFMQAYPKDEVDYANPYIVGPNMKLNMCQNILKNGQKHTVNCQAFDLKHLQNLMLKAFSNFDSYAFTIKPDTQLVLYEKDQIINYKTPPYSLRDLLVKNKFDNENIDKIVKNVPKSFFRVHQSQSTMSQIEQKNSKFQSDEEIYRDKEGIFGIEVESEGVKKYINGYQANVTYLQNNELLVDSVFVNFSIIDYNSIQISSDQLQSQIYKQSIYTLIIGLILSLLVFIFVMYTISKITMRFVSSLNNLIQILNQLCETHENQCLINFQDEVIDQLIQQKENFLLAKEFQDLFETFERLLKTLQYASIQLSEGNQCDSLLHWNRAVQFFEKSSQSNRALGICWNNIGMIHYQQKRYLEAAQSFKQAIIQADYELGLYDENFSRTNYDISILDLKFKRIYSYSTSIRKFMKQNKDISIWDEFKKIMTYLRVLAQKVGRQVKFRRLIIQLDLVDSLINANQPSKAQKYINFAFKTQRNMETDNSNSDLRHSNKQLSLIQKVKKNSEDSLPPNMQQFTGSKQKEINSSSSLKNGKSSFQINSSQYNFNPNNFTTNIEQSPVQLSFQKNIFSNCTLVEKQIQYDSTKSPYPKVQKQNQSSDYSQAPILSFNKKYSGVTNNLPQIYEKFENSQNSIARSISSINIESEDNSFQVNRYKTVSNCENNRYPLYNQFKPDYCFGDIDILHPQDSIILEQSKSQEVIYQQYLKPHSHQPFPSFLQLEENSIELQQKYNSWLRQKLVSKYKSKLQKLFKGEEDIITQLIDDDCGQENSKDLQNFPFKSQIRFAKQREMTYQKSQTILEIQSPFEKQTFTRLSKHKESILSFLNSQLSNNLGNTKSQEQAQLVHKNSKSQKDQPNQKFQDESSSFKKFKQNDTGSQRDNSILSSIQNQKEDLRDSNNYQVRGIERKMTENFRIKLIPQQIIKTILALFQAKVFFLQSNWKGAAYLLTDIFEQSQIYSAYLNQKVIKLLLQILKNSKKSLLPIYQITSTYGSFSLNVSFLIDCEELRTQFQASKLISSIVLKTLQEKDDVFSIHLNDIFQTTLIKDLYIERNKYHTVSQLKTLFTKIQQHFRSGEEFSEENDDDFEFYEQIKKKTKNNLKSCSFKYFLQKSLSQMFINSYHELKVKNLYKQNEQLDFKKIVKKVLIIITDNKIPQFSIKDERKLKKYSKDMDIDILHYDLSKFITVYDNQLDNHDQENSSFLSPIKQKPNLNKNNQYSFIKETITERKKLVSYLNNQRQVVKKFSLISEFEYF